jgi:ADP-ribose pyrophosphatase
MSKRGWHVKASSYVVNTRFLRLRKDTIELPSGEIVNDYYVRESRGFIVVFAVTADQRVVLVRQYKHGIAKEVLELPAGAIDPGENAEQTVQRELREETGYTADSFELVRSFVVDPTNSDTLAHLFLARNAMKTAEQDLDATEDIRVELATFDELREHVRSGSIESMPHVAAIYLVFDVLGYR